MRNISIGATSRRSSFRIDSETEKALGVDAAVRVTEEQLGKYKYQIDIGGAGGTTYTGTISKLSMPGVLLHHETATVDSYHHSLIRGCTTSQSVPISPISESACDGSRSIRKRRNKSVMKARGGRGGSET